MFTNAKPIDLELLDKYNKEIENDKEAKLLQHALSRSSIKNAIYNQKAIHDLSADFSIQVKTLSATNQQSSGRCWIFAATNLLREIAAKNLNVEKFELSQNYISFYDKLEKINYALEACIDFAPKEHDDRVVAQIVSYPVSDGGQWDMFKDLVKKYGVVPQSVMTETYISNHTREHNYIVNNAIRKFAATAHKMYLEGKSEKEIRALKDKILKELYRSLVIVFGSPVKEFDFEYTDKDNKYHIERNMTPKSFFDKFIGVDMDDYISIINSPTKDKPYYNMFTLDYIGNVIGGSDIHHLNLPMPRIKELVIESLKNNEPVWFGSDCGEFSDSDTSRWAPELFDYELAFNLDLKMSKEDMLDYYSSAMNHAMLITAVNLKDDLPTKWKIENSWGESKPLNGYHVASDSWFDEYVFQVVINKKYLGEKELEALKKEAIHLNPWDPMGTLAEK